MVNHNNKENGLNIVQFIDTYYPNIDGVVSVTNHYAKRLNIMGKCTVIAPKRRKYVDDSPYEIIRCNGFLIPFLKMDFAMPNTDYQLKKIMKHGNFDLFHAHSPFSMGRYALNMGRKLGVPVVTTFHTKYFDDFKKILKLDILAKGLLKNIIDFYEKADEVWTVNNNMIDTLREYGYNGDVIVMDNGTEFDYPKDAEQLKENINQLFKFSKDETVLTFVGQMIFQKNIKLIIESAKLLKDRGVKFKLLMVGTGYNEKYIKDYTIELGLQNEVIYTGRVSDRRILSGIYARSNLLLFPSLYDASSIVLIEAAAHKLPGLLIKDATTAERIVNGHNGFLCESTPECYSEKITELLNKQILITAAGENAYNEIYINWDSIIKKAQERYKYVINKHRIDKQSAQYKKRHEWS
ncbi:MAG: glycosyltransferase [Clostridia bacterium]|nr:glycosyltransferase [Clostridia bacterium]